MTTAIIIDPALTTDAGHNFGAALRIRAELQKLGVEVVCFSSVLADAAVRKHTEPVLPEKGLWWRSEPAK